MRALTLSAVSLFVLSGCVSSYENPYYQHSTYQPADAAQTVPNTMLLETTTVAYTAPLYETAPVQPVFDRGVEVEVEMIDAPTDSLYVDRSVTGTPGYMAVQGEAPDGSAVTVAAGTQIEYDYSQNLITAEAETTPQFSETISILPNADNTYAGSVYIVETGDTVYSLSREICVGVGVIQSMNGLDGNYGINIGQQIQLPASQC